MNNASLATADRLTHLKVVVLALVASIAIMVIGITAHAVDDTRAYGVAAVPVKAGKVMVSTTDAPTLVR
ncbi:hypothetical protein PQJ75_02475 [Rhodoplanes sp. TEM]|uniref:Uncharacterized protein n=1 Tax=Rhodoplanes tepidamans TaxID=200616 RepID=A0ABT5J650_RHOTP|nr:MULTISPECIES: hypothetical protein [Rhodoplanes]MDC7785113.1 hypothetical protein [Rhodoplanes tepidamans]MDC7982587.1 hypothetical protein [Rhodoplanes sp. TEM]MDQ0356603.1 hypothetical protein [Rhodoplanes tepidamans]